MNFPQVVDWFDIYLLADVGLQFLFQNLGFHLVRKRTHLDAIPVHLFWDFHVDGLCFFVSHDPGSFVSECDHFTPKKIGFLVRIETANSNFPERFFFDQIDFRKTPFLQFVINLFGIDRFNS